MAEGKGDKDAELARLHLRVAELEAHSASLQDQLNKIAELNINLEPILASNNDTEQSQHDLAEARSLFSLTHVQAAQRAVAFIGLKRTLLTAAMRGAKAHLSSTLAQKDSGAEWFKIPYVYPLQTHIQRLEEEVEEATISEELCRRRFMELREEATRPVVLATRRTMRQFSEVFRSLDEQQLVDLNTAVVSVRTESGAGTSASQPVGEADDPRSLPYLEQLFKDADQASLTLTSLLEDVVGKHDGMVVVHAALKTPERALEKAMEEGAGNFARLCDLARASIVCESVSLMRDAIRELSAQAAASAEVSVVAVSNQMDLDFDADVLSGGYRDLVANLAIAAPGSRRHHVCEVQVHLRAMAEVKSKGGAIKLHRQARALHMMDRELGEEWVHDLAGFDQALLRVRSGGCRSLRLDFTRVGVDHLERLCAGLTDPVCSVEEISILDCDLGQHTGVFDGKQFEGLREVVLSMNKHMTGRQVAAFVSKHLQVLKLRNTELSGEAFGHVVDRMNVSRPRRLVTLDLYRCSLGERGGYLLANELPKFSSLTYLSLFKNAMGPAAGQAVMSKFPLLVNLENLDMAANKLGVEGARHLADGIRTLKSLRVLTFRSNEMGPEGYRHMAGAIAQLTNLTELYASSNEAGPEGMRHLAEALPHLPHLSRLHVNDNGLKAEGAQFLAPALPALTELTVLYVSGNDIGPKGAQAIARGIAGLTRMTVLYTQKNNIGEEGARHLGEVLANFPHMIEISCYSNKLGAKGTKHLAAAFQHHPDMVRIDIHDNNIKGEGAKYLAEGVANMNRLNKLYLRDNNLSEKDRTKFKERVAHLHIPVLKV